MGKYTLGDAIGRLHVSGVWARRGYPGGMMPHVTETTVAVNIHKSTPEGIVMVAEVCTPMPKGVHACEDMAKIIEEAWLKDGGRITYGGHTFDGKSGLYQMSVYGEWTYTEEDTATEST